MRAALATALKVLFWCALTAEVAWLVLEAAAWDTVFSAFGQGGVGLVTLLILGSLALCSGLLIPLERRANGFVEPERQWSLAESVYALVLFGSLFFGVYAFFGWYYAP